MKFEEALEHARKGAVLFNRKIKDTIFTLYVDTDTEKQEWWRHEKLTSFFNVQLEALASNDWVIVGEEELGMLSFIQALEKIYPHKRMYKAGHSDRVVSFSEDRKYLQVTGYFPLCSDPTLEQIMSADWELFTP